MVGPADGDLPGEEGDHARAALAARGARRGPTVVCCASARRIGAELAWQIATASASAAWSGRGSSSSSEQRLDHPLDLVLGGATGPADRALDLLRRVGPARDPALARGQQHDSARLPDGEAPSARWRRSRAPPPPAPAAGARRAARRRGRGSRPAARRARARARSAPRRRPAPPSARPAAPRRRSPCWRCPDRCRGRSSSRRGFCAAGRTPHAGRGDSNVNGGW